MSKPTQTLLEILGIALFIDALTYFGLHPRPVLRILLLAVAGILVIEAIAVVVVDLRARKRQK